MSQTVINFLNAYYGYAQQMEEKYGVPALVALAQSAIESGWSSSKPGNMMFGIKAGASWKGQTQKLRTWEFGKTGNAKTDRITDEIIAIYKPGDPNNPFENKGYAYRVYGIFRKYNSPYDSFVDYANMLKNNSIYKKAFSYISEPLLFAAEIAKAGYATDPNYYSKIKSIIGDFITTIATMPELATKKKNIPGNRLT